MYNLTFSHYTEGICTKFAYYCCVFWIQCEQLCKRGTWMGHWAFVSELRSFRAVEKYVFLRLNCPTAACPLIQWKSGPSTCLDAEMVRTETDAGEGDTMVLRHWGWRFVHIAAGQVWVALDVIHPAKRSWAFYSPAKCCHARFHIIFVPICQYCL